MNRTDIKDANDFREAIIGIVNYMAFAQKEVVTLREPIEVVWGLTGTANYKGKRMVLPTIALDDRTDECLEKENICKTTKLPCCYCQPVCNFRESKTE